MKPIHKALSDKQLRNLYLDYFNNYMSVKKFAEDNNLSNPYFVISKGRKLHQSHVDKKNNMNLTIHTLGDR